VTRRPLAFAPALCALLATIRAGAQIVPPLDPESDAVRQCMQQIQNAPAKSAEIAEKRLAQGGLAPIHELGWIQCSGNAEQATGHPLAIADLARRAQQILDTHWPELSDLQRANALNMLGNVQSIAGDLPAATVTLHRLQLMTSTTPVTQYQINAAMMMGQIYGPTLNAPEAAEPYFRKARDLSEGHARSQPMIDYQYAYTLMELNRYEEARQLLDQLAQRLQTMPNERGMLSRVNTQRAMILDAGEQHEQAGALLETSLATQREIGDLAGQAYTLAQLASHHWTMGNHALALSLAQQAASLSRQGRFAQQEEDALRLLVKFHESTGDSAQALAALKRADELTRATLKNRNLRDRAAVDAALRQQDGTVPARESSAGGAVPAAALAGIGATTGVALAALLLWRRERSLRREQLGRDALTGLTSRQAMLAALAQCSDSRRALLLIAIDKFDTINDLHGYHVGDRMLHQLAGKVRSICCARDVAARWSDDSFLVAIVDATPEETDARAEQLRRSVEESAIDLSDGDALKISISIGAAPLPFFPHDALSDWHDSLRLANRALQSAQRSGANAWASIWGLETGDNHSTISIAQSPRRAAEAGQVRLEASSPLAWQN